MQDIGLSTDRCCFTSIFYAVTFPRWNSKGQKLWNANWFLLIVLIMTKTEILKIFLFRLHV